MTFEKARADSGFNEIKIFGGCVVSCVLVVLLGSLSFESIVNRRLRAHAAYKIIM